MVKYLKESGADVNAKDIYVSMCVSIFEIDGCHTDAIVNVVSVL